MNELLMLDTNTVSDIVRGKSKAARARLASLSQNEVACISVITEAELLFGLAKQPKAHALKAAIDAFLSKIQILDWGRREAFAYGQLRAKQEAAGKSLGNMDMMIAAHAIASGATLVSNDNAFGNVPDLRAVVSWATDL